MIWLVQAGVQFSPALVCAVVGLGRGILIIAGSYYWFLGHCFVYMLFGFYLAHTIIIKHTQAEASQTNPNPNSHPVTRAQLELQPEPTLRRMSSSGRSARPNPTPRRRRVGFTKRSRRRRAAGAGCCSMLASGGRLASRARRCVVTLAPEPAPSLLTLPSPGRLLHRHGVLCVGAFGGGRLAALRGPAPEPRHVRQQP